VRHELRKVSAEESRTFCQSLLDSLVSWIIFTKFANEKLGEVGCDLKHSWGEWALVFALTNSTDDGSESHDHLGGETLVLNGVLSWLWDSDTDFKWSHEIIEILAEVIADNFGNCRDQHKSFNLKRLVLLLDSLVKVGSEDLEDLRDVLVEDISSIDVVFFIFLGVLESLAEI